MVRQLPMVLFGNGLSCLFASMAISGSYSLVECLPIVLGMWLLLVPVAVSWVRLRHRPDPVRVSASRIHKLTAYSGLLGCTLAGFMLWYLPSTPFEVAAIIIMGCGFMAAGSAAVLYIIPWACVVYASPIMLAALYLVATSASPSVVPITLLVGLMGCGVGWMLYANWQNFHALLVVSEEKTQLLKTAARAAAAKSEFLENMSHEIKNPLTSVIGFANLLRDAENQIAPELRPYVKNVVNGGEALKMLLNDILDLAKLDADHIKLHAVPFQIRELLQDAVSLVSLGARAKNLAVNVTVDADVPVWQLADPFRLRQVMLNLLSNAIKFTAHGRVDVHASWQPAGVMEAGWLCVQVADTGPGIPRPTQLLLFKRFAKGEAVTSGLPEGSGLGLAICRRLLDLMGGTIRLRSGAGYGSVFDFDLPTRVLAAPVGIISPTTLSSAGVLPPPLLQGKKILVVDDLAPNRELVRLLLEPLGHTIVEASSGTQVVTLCQLEGFDLILMDIDMPSVDGMMATRLVRSQCPMNARTPVIAVSGHVSKSQLIEFLDAGMNDHLAKPLYRAALILKVNAWTMEAPPQAGHETPIGSAAEA